MASKSQIYIVEVEIDEESNKPLSETWRRASDRIMHRDDGPALIYYDPVSRVATAELWYKDGETHREKADGPAMVRRNRVTGEVIAAHYIVDGNEIAYEPEY